MKMVSHWIFTATDASIRICRRYKMTDQKDKQQVIIEGLITTLSYREQRIDELEAELITWKTRAEIAERRNKYLLKKLDEVQNDTK